METSVNNKCRGFTSLEQSRKLAEILPLESADGFWEYHDKWYSEGDEWEGYEDYPRAEPYLEYTREENEWKEYKLDIPCWSLDALLKILAKIASKIDDDGSADLSSFMGQWSVNMFDCPVEATDNYDNPINACVAMIEKLHELKML